LRNESGNSPFTAWLWINGKSDPTSEPVGFNAVALSPASAASELNWPLSIEPKPATAVACRKVRRLTCKVRGGVVGSNMV
jgi:hypothetical protein